MALQRRLTPRPTRTTPPAPASTSPMPTAPSCASAARRARCPLRRRAAPVPRRAAARRPAAPDRPRAPTVRCRARPRRGRNVDRRLIERRVHPRQLGQGARSVRTLPGRQEPLDRRACDAQAQGGSGAASRRQSLRRAQLATLDGTLGAGRWNHPFYWAPCAGTRRYSPASMRGCRARRKPRGRRRMRPSPACLVAIVRCALQPRPRPRPQWRRAARERARFAAARLEGLSRRERAVQRGAGGTRHGVGAAAARRHRRRRLRRLRQQRVCMGGGGSQPRGQAAGTEP